MQYQTLIFVVLIIVVMYFTMIRPQKKRQQEHQKTINNLSKGDHVVTIGRLHGVVDTIDKSNNTVTLDCDGIYLEFDLNAIASVKAATTAAASTSEDNDDAKSATSDSADAKPADEEATK
ncbi:preprotein translocase subunit YajC [Lactobacillus sp. Sy-1]|uniref:preprotein translocase subunit YajC n=1 Tax=Lactobacillus sp. Sy-1 TaxID=2109645 RepID=UPI001C560275|nr:preprotein translocase subunit YajC [Lactobacillus sp. Sy-1]MBW1605788.1 preprotein translocase subunit YajC [Lactobacillus sp. Sy-1]